MGEDRRKILEKFEANRDELERSVQAGIEAYRKGGAVVKAVDSEGKPIAGAKVTVRQKNHAFRYGANLFMLDELETPEKNEKYKEAFKRIFNMATLPFYWSDLEPEEGKPRYAKNSPKIYRRPAPDLCMEYCKQNGIEPREHALAYDAFFPKWLYDADIFKIKKKFEQRCAEISARYGADIRTIEVTNETWWAQGKTAIYNDPDFVEYSFKTARKYFGANELSINEYAGVWDDNARTDDRYYMQVENALMKGAEIDAIGMQYHMFHRAEEEYERTRRTYDPNHLRAIMDLYGRFNKPIQITEVTIPAYSNKPEDEQLQAEIIRWLYSIWFSQPQVEQIIYWNLVDGYAAWAPQGDMTAGENYYYGGLMRFDLTPKPAYDMIDTLFNKEWRTNLDIEANADGETSFRGFYGDYELTVQSGDKSVTKSVTLSKTGKNEFTVTL